MKFNADTILIDRDGKIVKEPITDERGERTNELRTVTHGILAVRAIDAQMQGDADLKAEEVRRRFILGAKIMAGGVVDLSTEDAALIQKRLCVFPVPVSGPVIMALDGDYVAAPVRSLSANGHAEGVAH